MSALLITGTESVCPDCGHDAARVRTRGNAYAATCAQCRRTDVMPMLDGDLLDAFDEDTHQPCAVVPLARRQGNPQLPQREDGRARQSLAVSFSGLQPRD